MCQAACSQHSHIHCLIESLLPLNLYLESPPSSQWVQGCGGLQEWGREVISGGHIHCNQWLQTARALCLPSLFVWVVKLLVGYWQKGFTIEDNRSLGSFDMTLFLFSFKNLCLLTCIVGEQDTQLAKWSVSRRITELFMPASRIFVRNWFYDSLQWGLLTQSASAFKYLRSVILEQWCSWRCFPYPEE